MPSVVTLSALSSIILAYNLCTYRQFVKPSLVNYLKYVAHRWLSMCRRLVGPILVVYLLPLFGDGPIWHYFEQLHTVPCQNNLLSNLLFYNNYADSLDQVVSVFPSSLPSLNPSRSAISPR